LKETTETNPHPTIIILPSSNNPKMNKEIVFLNDRKKKMIEIHPEVKNEWKKLQEGISLRDVENYLQEKGIVPMKGHPYTRYGNVVKVNKRKSVAEQSNAKKSR